MGTAADSSLAVSYAGYGIVARFDQVQAGDGRLSHLCQLTASEIGERADALVFTRTLVLGDAQAALMNTAQPGIVPALDRLQAELGAHGMRYMETLVDVVNRGFRAIAPVGNRSVSDARSFLGMTDAALQTREG
ncbi:MAG TPA: hypothetical protein VFD32_05270 [Dehalococcoidia bacterium]|nr:hypothetical protein [Dehalococcoidia bacterium]